MAARINLNGWIAGRSNRYIAFRIGRGAREVTDYFSKFIGCEEYTRARADTQNLVKVTARYCAAHDLNDTQTEQIKKFVYDTCVDWLDQETPVLIENISSILDARLDVEEESKFIEIAQSDPFFLSNEIPVEKSALRGLTRYSGKSANMSISFDSSLLNVSVFYSTESTELRITDVPASLREQLTPAITE